MTGKTAEDQRQGILDRAELLDKNIVVVPSQPVSQFGNVASLVETPELSRFVRSPISISQVLTLDAQRGAAPALQIESMRSQKTITLSPTRIEVHDLSGAPFAQDSDLPLTTVSLMHALALEDVSAVGTNFQMVIELPEGKTAGREIVSRLLRDSNRFAPPGVPISGSGVHLFFGESEEPRYTIQIEPRANDLTTRNLWIAANCQVEVSQMPDVEELSNIFARAVGVMTQVVGRVFFERAGGAQ